MDFRCWVRLEVIHALLQGVATLEVGRSELIETFILCQITSSHIKERV